MTDAQRILLFIPMYNCAPQIARVLSRIDETIRPFLTEILIVDNRSNDGSDQAAVSALKAIGLPGSVVRNTKNYSLGGSHKVAFNYAIEHGFEWIIVLHGDDQADIRDLAPHLRDGTYAAYDSFLGSRFMKGARRIGYSTFRTIANYGFNCLCSLLCGRSISDQGSGLNLYAVRYLRDRFYMPFDDTLHFPNQMFFYGVHRGSRYTFFPITWREEDQISNARMWRQAYAVICLILSMKRVFANKAHAHAERHYRFDTVYRQAGCSE